VTLKQDQWKYRQVESSMTSTCRQMLNRNSRYIQGAAKKSFSDKNCNFSELIQNFTMKFCTIILKVCLHLRYLSVLLTDDLQKSYSVFQVLPFLCRSIEFISNFHFYNSNVHNP